MVVKYSFSEPKSCVLTCKHMYNSFLVGGDFCHLPVTFANNLDPHWDPQSVGPDVNPKPFDTLIKCS